MPLTSVIAPRIRPVGAGEVRRLLPYRERRSVGPFVFLDRIGPDPLPAGSGIDVAAHPHIGLATLTLLLEGALVHRDSTGAEQRIDPGAVNWMHAGRGVAHSERSPDDERAADTSIAGAQAWVALPAAHEDDDPFFEHHAADALPVVDVGGVTVRLLVGEGWGETSPVTTVSPMVYALAEVPPTPAGGSTALTLPDAPEIGLVPLDAPLDVDGTEVPVDHVAVLDGPGSATSPGPNRVLVLGGEPLGPRRMWWNLVATTQERIDAASRRWRDDDFDPVPGETERIPLPE